MGDAVQIDVLGKNKQINYRRRFPDELGVNTWCVHVYVCVCVVRPTLQRH